MANYNQVSYGSEGRDVTELQKLLNKNGYSLDEDGVFGSKTQAAVRDYQKKNNLDVDGIVGDNTWGALTKSPSGSSAGSSSGGSSSGSSTQAPAPAPAPTYGAGDYKPSDTVLAAEQLLQQQLANKPGAYQSAWQTQLDDTINKILNREKFSYDLNGDALYQQYKDKYIQQGQMAMMDTMGQAAAMTGGYGNSYAQSVGQQAYQGQLQNMNDIVPELYQMALDQYNQEGQNLYNQYSMLGAQDAQDYGRYRDQVGDYNTELDRLTNDARYQAEMDYSKFLDDRATSQWQAQFDEAKRQYDQEYEQSAGKKTGNPTPSPAPNPGPTENPTTDDEDEHTDDNGGLSKAAIINMQKTLGVSEDGLWGPESQAATGGLSAAEAYKLWNQGKLEGAMPVSEGKVKAFIGKLNYLPGGGDTEEWKKTVESRLEQSDLNDLEKIAVLKQLRII